MGNFDEIRCDALLPEGDPTDGVHFQTKSLPDPSMQSYVITSSGRLLDMQAHDLEPDGCISFYTSDKASPYGRWRQYHARFSGGQLLSIVRVENNDSDRRHYGLASFRWYEISSPSFGDPPENLNAGFTRAVELILPDAVPGLYSNRQRIDARNLAIHCLVARKLLVNPRLIEQARSKIARWKWAPPESMSLDILEWERLLETSIDAIAGFLASMSDDATRLRQSSPFNDVLTPEERSRIYAAFR